MNRLTPMKLRGGGGQGAGQAGQVDGALHHVRGSGAGATAAHSSTHAAVAAHERKMMRPCAPMAPYVAPMSAATSMRR